MNLATAIYAVVVVVVIVVLVKAFSKSGGKNNNYMQCLSKCANEGNTCTQDCVSLCPQSEEYDTCVSSCGSMCSEQAMNCNSSCRNLK